MFKVGFELEMFVANEKGVVVVPPRGSGLPLDGGEVLVEARGKEDTDPVKAMFNLEWAIWKVIRRVERLGLCIHIENKVKAKDIEGWKGLEGRVGKEGRSDGFVGKEGFWKGKKGYITAGLHIHFSNSIEKMVPSAGNAPPFVVVEHMPLDIPKIVRWIEGRWGEDIREAGRPLGMYEMKPYGFEYRGLPGEFGREELLRELAEWMENEWMEIAI